MTDNERNGLMPELNEELIGKVLAHIEAHPETHDQGTYRGYQGDTLVYCFAGHATRIAVEEDEYSSFVDWRTDWTTGERYLWPTEGTHGYAREKLGLTDGEAFRIFLLTDDLAGVKAELDAARERRRVSA